MEYLNTYLEAIRKSGKPSLAEAINKTAEDVVPRYISDFSFTEHVVGLLVGDVQSGKTSHMFGLMCAAADEGFRNFVLLTTDNVILQQQTFLRAQRDLTEFCVCGENDYIGYVQNNLKKPAVIVLKKNPSVLRQWKNNFTSTKLCSGNPLFIVDDEADAASLNTLVNKQLQSTINRLLDQIKKTTSSSIYMEVTGTPRSILLQTVRSGWKPYFIYYFKPGKGYLGGNFFFTPEPPKSIVFTDNDEAEELLEDDEFPENGLKNALLTHLITSGHIMLNGGSVCNFLIHPSIVLPKYKTVVFVNGCFWHMHGCSRSRPPRSNLEYWEPKIKRNVQRDTENTEKLRSEGWKVLTVWECELKKDCREERLAQLCKEITGKM